MQNTGPGDSRGESDSGDENVPLEAERMPVFSSSELAVIDKDLENLWKNYHHAIKGHFSNGPGKLHYLLEYLGNCADCVDITFGKGAFSKDYSMIVRSCNQKCLDAKGRLKKIAEAKLPNKSQQ